MRKLQNNFTTPEQSKLLLELGVPADSADCYNVIDSDVYNKDEIRVRQNEYEISSSFFNNKHYNPVWSVGKLVEIHRICSTLPDEEYLFPFWKDQEDNVEWAIRVLESGIRTSNMNFSKLEE